jgi:hypothetical protein
VRYAQVRGGQKLHLVYEPGEGPEPRPDTGQVSQPLCGRRADGYRMTINVPLGQACQNCQRVWRCRTRRGT